MHKPQVTTGNLCCIEVSHSKEEEWNNTATDGKQSNISDEEGKEQVV